jgi:hypothetical protein
MGYFYSTPKGRLKLSKGLNDSTFHMGERTKIEIKGLCGWFIAKAVDNPGITQYRYHEENNYEYEGRAVYNEKDNTVITNTVYCPIRYNHHVGSTCGMCGEVG